MLYIHFLHFSFLFVLMLADVLLNAILTQVLPGSFIFSPKLTFIGLVLLMQNENVEKTLLKGVFLSMWMDLNHLSSFPIYLISYLLTILLVSYWKRHISTNIIEFSTIALVAIFIQENIAFLIAKNIHQIQMSYQYFLAFRFFGIAIFNILLIPLILNLYKRVHHAILAKTQDLSGY